MIRGFNLIAGKYIRKDVVKPNDPKIKLIPCNINETARCCHSSQLRPNTENSVSMLLDYKLPCNYNDDGVLSRPNGKYYKISQIGDGIQDCKNGRDEQNLSEQCTAEKYLVYCQGVDETKNGVKCIHVNQVGDGKIDCLNGWDESIEAMQSNCNADVGLIPCFEMSRFTIDNLNSTSQIQLLKKCIPVDRLGDGVDDCLDGSDEDINIVNRYCSTIFRSVCGNLTNAKSTDIKCISTSKIGNGITDCYNGYDELDTTIMHKCDKRKSASFKFYCGELNPATYQSVDKRPDNILQGKSYNLCSEFLKNCLLVKDELENESSRVKLFNQATKCNGIKLEPRYKRTLNATNTNTTGSKDVLVDSGTAYIYISVLIATGLGICYLADICNNYFKTFKNQQHGFTRAWNSLSLTNKSIVIWGRNLCTVMHNEIDSNDSNVRSDGADLPPPYNTAWGLEYNERILDKVTNDSSSNSNNTSSSVL